MTSVIIDSADRALDAGAWCRQQFTIGDWNIDLESMLGVNPRYEFQFASSCDAALFALKWVS